MNEFIPWAKHFTNKEKTQQPTLQGFLKFSSPNNERVGLLTLQISGSCSVRIFGGILFGLGIANKPLMEFIDSRLLNQSLSVREFCHHD